MSHSRKRAPLGLFPALQSALTLKGNFYEQVQTTPQHQHLALLVVVLASMSHGLGSLAILSLNQTSLPLLLLLALLDGVLILAGYFLWTLAIFKIGQKLKPIDPGYEDLLGPIGFAYTPQIFNFLTLIPLLGRPMELVLAAWSLLAAIVAIRQGLDISTGKATAICLLTWIPLQVAIGSAQLLYFNQ